MQIALVLGAGGPVGHAFHGGVLRALADDCGWEARGAQLIVGTSAGAHAGALLRAGWSAQKLCAHASDPAPAAAAEEAAPARRWPASTEYLRRSLARPWRARPGRLAAALLPEGARAPRPLAAAFGGEWPVEPLYVTAVHLDSGARVVFGRAGAPRVDVATAVRCSSAVPGVRRPVVLERGRFVDGGIASATHVDLVADGAAPPDLALVLSPLSRFWPMRLLLRAELRALARRNIRVALFEPDAEVARAMGWNPLDPRAAPAVAAAAYRSARRHLRAPVAVPLRERLARATAATSASTSR
jgi:NTE family protein